MRALSFGSVCSGIGAPECGWSGLGWSEAFLSEIEPFPRAVLSHRFPDVPLHGDFTTIQRGDYAAIDLLVGGTPCQSFSVAGLRRGMADERGNLALEYLRLADRLRPRWLVWENVPGVLSSNGGRDFGSFLGGVRQLGYRGCYRVLDAQHFGVAQRRRRVFFVGYLGDWRPAAAVLLEPASLRGHPAPRREAGERTSPTLSSRTSAGGGLGTDHDINGGLIMGADVARCLTGKKGYRSDGESETFIAHSLRGEVFDASEDGTGRGTPLVPVHAIQAGALRENPDSGPDGVGVQESIAYTLEARAEVQAIAFDLAQITSAANRTRAEPGLPTSTLAKQSRMHAATSSAVRRLTPREAERLQGFPDDWTLIQYRGKPAADGPRYKAIGNSMAVPVLRWIGRRLEAVERQLSERRTAA